MATSSLTFVTTLAKHYILSDSIIPCQHSISTLSRSISKINAYRLTVTLQVLKGTYEVVIKRNVAMVYLMRVRNRVLRNWGVTIRTCTNTTEHTDGHRDTGQLYKQQWRGDDDHHLSQILQYTLHSTIYLHRHI